jgi:hypothetical protein
MREPPGNHSKGGWVDSRADFDTVKYKQITFPCQKSNTVNPANSLPTEPSRIPEFYA